MSYDIGLKDPATGKWVDLPVAHNMKGGTYPIGGSRTARFNITYNYAEHIRRVIEPVAESDSIRALYGSTGEDSIPVLERAISMLGTDEHEDYWKPTEGNVRKALECCLVLARLCPDGVWSGD